MFEAGKEYKTRNGRTVRIYATDARGNYPVHGAIAYQDSPLGWEQMSWSESGEVLIDNESVCDIMPPPREVFVVYLQGQVHCTSDTLEGFESFVKNSLGFEIVKFVEATDAN